MNIKKLHAKIKYKEIFDLYGTDFSKISKCDNLPYDFIDMYFMRLRPFHPERHQIFNDLIFEKYANKINWILALKYQKISEYILEDNYDKLNKILLAKTQKLSKSFIKKHVGDLQLKYLEKNPHISIDEIREFF